MSLTGMAAFSLSPRKPPKQKPVSKRRLSGKRCLVQRRRSEGGFTLVEVLVAMVLLAVGIVGTMRVAGVNTQASAQARDIVVATTLAQSIMNEITQNPDLAAGSESGDFSTVSPEHSEYLWESLVEASPDETGLLVVNVAVLWRSGYNERRLNVSTQVLDPAYQTELGAAAGANAPAGGAGTPGG